MFFIKPGKRSGIMSQPIVIYRFLSISAVFMIFALTGCIKNEENRGYITEFSHVEQINKGDSKDAVVNVLGSPSSTSTFGKETWYYIGMKMQTQAFKDPKMVNKDIIAITFNDRGLVDSVERNKAEGGKEVDIAKDITPTSGNHVGVVEQLLGNLGRFNPKDNN